MVHGERYTPPPDIACVHQCFEQRAAEAPDAIAIVFNDTSLSYRELNERANRLAHHLQHLGVGPDVLVGSCLPRSCELIVCILGILKAGGTYVPLDPAYPHARLASMLEDARPPVLVTTSDLRDQLPGTGATVVSLDTDWSAISGQPPDTPDCRATGDDLMYVIFTSGSTGPPKGVMVTHRNVVHLYRGLPPSLCFDATDIWTMFHSCAFGFSVWEIWGALIHGGRLIVLPTESCLSPSALLDELCRRRVTVLSQTPSAFRQLLLPEVPTETADRLCLRMIVFSGEPVVSGDLRRWFDRARGRAVQLIDTYAITEAGGQIACRLIEPSDIDDSGTLDIGDILSGTTVHILDEQLRPVPTGSTGELHVAGPGLARGYLNRPALTRDRFPDDPFSRTDGGRLYRTGDRARILPDGRIALIGRVDDQVKIRGYRVEPGEIEAALSDHDAVHESAVVCRRDASGDNRLFGYVVPIPEYADAPKKQSTANADDHDRIELWPSLGEHQLYDEVLYDLMAADPVRLDQYRKAIDQHVRDRVVVDIGTGQDALLARFCVEAGARKVYAIEIIDEAFRRARSLVESLGLADRIDVIHGDATRLQLPEPAEVCVHGLFGNIGSADGIVPIMNDARRFLKPEAVTIPPRCITRIAPVQIPPDLKTQPSFRGLARTYVKRVFQHVGRRSDLRLCVRNFPRDHLIANAGTFEELDFSDFIAPERTGRSEFAVTDDARLDAFLLWVQVHITDDAPIDYLEHSHGWLPVIFPISDTGISVSRGDRISATWTCTVSANGRNPDYAICGQVVRSRARDVAFAYASPHRVRAYRSTAIHRLLFDDLDRADLSVTSLQSHLRRTLPDYMIPSDIMVVDEMPRTPSGKLDRSALPSPDSATRVPSTPFVDPATPLQRRIAAIWESVLDRDAVGIDQEFLEAGGHSLAAAQILARLRVKEGVELPPSAVFDHPTVRQLSALISGCRRIPKSQHVADPHVETTPGSADDRKFMLLAIEQASRALDKDGVPFGACITRAGSVVTTVHNSVLFDGDPTAHAEVCAIRRACRALGSLDLADCVMYTTCEPCPMCYAACHEAHISRIVYGIGHDDANAFGTPSLAIGAAKMGELGHASIELTPDVLREQVLALFERWSLRRAETVAARSPKSSPHATHTAPRQSFERIDRANVDHVPLSYSQQRLWFLDRIEDDLTAYNHAEAFRIVGDLKVEALRRSFEAVIHRHESLRTNFRVHEGEAFQVIRTPAPFDLPVVDLREGATHPQDEEISRRRDQEAMRTFDLTRDLMLRASLLRLRRHEHILLLTNHHAAADGWSEHVLWRDVSAFYAAHARNGTANLPELTIQYADFAVCQRNALEESRRDDLLRYWRKQLEGIPALELPTDSPRPSVLTHCGARHDFELNETLRERLQSLGQSEGLTLHMMLLAGFKILLSRYSHQLDVAVGTPVAARSDQVLEDLVGVFINVVVLRTDLSGDPTVREILRRIRDVSLAAYDHQDLPFEKLVEELQPERQLNRDPLIQTLFQLTNFPELDPALDGVDVSRLTPRHHPVRFDLDMHIRQGPGGFRGAVSYSTDLFNPATIERMVGHFLTLLESIVTNPNQRLGALRLLPDAERHQQLVTWNHMTTETTTDTPRNKCVHELFEEQVERSPDAIALVFGDRQLTYRALNDRADLLASRLRNQGVGPETLVGLHLERSPELIIGVLGILKAGGAYVPLDVDDPPSRIEALLGDAKIDILVTQDPSPGAMPAGCRVVRADEDDSLLQNLPGSNSPVDVGEDNLAYVMFTSGTTGRPKGVEIRHRSIARLVFGTDYAKFGPDRVFVHLAPISFDASTFELWGALLHGAKLVITPPGVPDLRQLEKLLKRHRVTTLWLTATLLNQIVEHRPQVLGGIDEVLTGGEPLSVTHVRAAQSALGPRPRFTNAYGPTECTTFATCYRLPRRLAPDVESVPIGRPIANTQVFVLDDQRQPVPIGVRGELYIGGSGLARGYLDQPALTAARFVPNPFGGDPDARMYRTGDLVRWRADGEIEFLGRVDDQVKLRGFRIEPGEIEYVLTGHPDVARSVVTAREDRPGEKRLVAYFVPARDVQPNDADLARHVRRRLPRYMVPTAFVRLDALPQLPGGKVDRRALPPPIARRSECDPESVAPRTPTEKQLAAIWCDLLGLDRVGADDRFFELGGHSLMAVPLFDRIEKIFGRSLPLATLYERDTIGHLATLLDEQPGSASTVASAIPLREGGQGRRLFLFPSIGGELMYFRHVLEKLDRRFPVTGIQPDPTPENVEAFRDIPTTAHAFVEAVQACQSSGPYALAGFSYGGLMAYEVACMLEGTGEEVDLLAVIDTGPGPANSESRSTRPAVRLAWIAMNLPFWLRDEIRHVSAPRWIERVRRTIPRWYRHVASHGRAPIEFDHFMDINRIPSRHRELTRTAFAAFRDFAPRPYAGRLVLLRAKTQPLLSDWPRDLGWGRVAGDVEIRQIDGNHESIVHGSHAGALAGELGALLDDLDPAAPQPSLTPNPPPSETVNAPNARSASAVGPMGAAPKIDRYLKKRT
ncbi:MAG: hypothetical protein CMJ18_25610 [Phycisphaeraceae bacterium]|nr:hypothetical protein [Phycisphaeraceae bacterium]